LGSLFRGIINFSLSLWSPFIWVLDWSVWKWKIQNRVP
jgi:hypothetical protein